MLTIRWVEDWLFKLRSLRLTKSIIRIIYYPYCHKCIHEIPYNEPSKRAFSRLKVLCKNRFVNDTRSLTLVDLVLTTNTAPEPPPPCPRMTLGSSHKLRKEFMTSIFLVINRWNRVAFVFPLSLPPSLLLVKPSPLQSSTQRRDVGFVCLSLWIPVDVGLCDLRNS